MNTFACLESYLLSYIIIFKFSNPPTLLGIACSKDGQGVSEMAQDDSATCVPWSGDEESHGETLSMPYQKTREWLCRNWEALKVPLLQSSVGVEGFILLKYVGGDCDRDAQTWCWDCSFGYIIASNAAMNCTD